MRGSRFGVRNRLAALLCEIVFLYTHYTHTRSRHRGVRGGKKWVVASFLSALAPLPPSASAFTRHAAPAALHSSDTLEALQTPRAPHISTALPTIKHTNHTRKHQKKIPAPHPNRHRSTQEFVWMKAMQSATQMWGRPLTIFREVLEPPAGLGELNKGHVALSSKKHVPFRPKVQPELLADLARAQLIVRSCAGVRWAEEADSRGPC